TQVVACRSRSGGGGRPGARFTRASGQSDPQARDVPQKNGWVAPDPPGSVSPRRRPRRPAPSEGEEESRAGGSAKGGAVDAVLSQQLAQGAPLLPDEACGRRDVAAASGQGAGQELALELRDDEGLGPSKAQLERNLGDHRVGGLRLRAAGRRARNVEVHHASLGEQEAAL